MIAWLMIAPLIQPNAAAELSPGDPASAVAGDSQDQKKDEPKAVVEVTGRVVNRSAKGVAGIDLDVEGPKGRILPKPKTDSTGAYKFQGPAGKYKVTATANGNSSKIEADIDKSKELPALILNTEDHH